MLFINGKFPGPLIEANMGDRLVINVTNNLVANSTTMHYHGLYQNHTNWYDGTNGTFMSYYNQRPVGCAFSQETKFLRQVSPNVALSRGVPLSTTSPSPSGAHTGTTHTTGPSIRTASSGLLLSTLQKRPRRGQRMTKTR